MAAISAKTALLHQNRGPGFVGLSDDWLVLPEDVSSVIITAVPSGNSPQALVQVYDAAPGLGDWAPGLDPNADPVTGGGSLLGKDKWLVTNLAGMVKVYLAVTAGIWNVYATWVRASPTFPAMLAGSSIFGGNRTFARNVGAAQGVLSRQFTLYGVSVLNNQAAAAFVQFFDAASAGSVTLGTTIPLEEWMVAANSQLVVPFPVNGEQFLSGLVVASTTTELGAVPSAAGVHVHLGFV